MTIAGESVRSETMVRAEVVYVGQLHDAVKYEHVNLPQLESAD